MVARHGKLVKFRRFGYQTLESREPLREDAIFRIASMTKPIIPISARGFSRKFRPTTGAAYTAPGSGSTRPTMSSS
jgi:Beta-lactamase